MVPSFASFPVWGSTAVVGTTDADALAAAQAAVKDVLDAVDLACSRFREDSEIAALARAHGQPVPVGQVLFDAVSAGLRAARLTDGDVDPTLGQVLRALGYDRDFDELAGRGPARVRVAVIPGWQAVTLDVAHRTIQVPAGVELDLGATAKALAADRSAQAVHVVTGVGALVSLGGDIALAGEPPPDGWRVRVTDDHRAGTEAPGQWITLRDGGLATSSTSVRRWQTDAGEAHHLIDPSTGHPATGEWRTVSVCAASCLDANIASTAAIIRGAASRGWLAAQRLPSRLVSHTGSVVHVAGWPQDGDDLPAMDSAVAAGQS
ncbi:MAG: FAD:protein transferase [Solirubrobacteraceae bacterium]|nr:FAD:protein transferase [Solirubrobacteraceae bacterium]